MKKRVSDALYSLCKSHCKNKPHGLFPLVSFFFFFFLSQKRKIVYVYDYRELKGQKCSYVCFYVSIRLEISMGKTFRPYITLGTLFWPNLIGSIFGKQKIWQKRLLKMDLWMLFWMFMMLISACYESIHTFHSEKTQDLYFRKSSSWLGSSSTRESMYIWITILFESWLNVYWTLSKTWRDFHFTVMAEQSWSLYYKTKWAKF